MLIEPTVNNIQNEKIKMEFECLQKEKKIDIKLNSREIIWLA